MPTRPSVSRNRGIAKILLCASLLSSLVLSGCSYEWLESKSVVEKGIRLLCRKDGAFADRECSRLAKDTLAIVDYEMDVESRSLAFFSNELLRLIQMPRVRVYLKELAVELDRSTSTSFDLWSWSVKKLGSVALTEDVFTVLFQDHIHPYHVSWLEKVHAHQETTADLRAVLERLGDRECLKRIRFYPPDVTDAQIESFNEKIYYYYLPKRIYRGLLERGWSEYFARTWVIYVILTYKAHHHFRPKSDLFWEPHPLWVKGGFQAMTTAEQNAWRYRLRDAYMGYVGTGGKVDFPAFFESLIR